MRECSYVPLVTPNAEHAARRRAELGDRLRATRKSAGLTQEATALEAGLDRSFYVDVENGHHSLTVERLFAIADALGTSPADLLAGIH